MIFRTETKNKTSKRKHADADSLEVLYLVGAAGAKAEEFTSGAAFWLSDTGMEPFFVLPFPAESAEAEKMELAKHIDLF